MARLSALDGRTGNAKSPHGKSGNRQQGPDPATREAPSGLLLTEPMIAQSLVVKAECHLF
jgi:hypothetical protein